MEPPIEAPLTQEAKNWAVIAHLAALINIVGIPSVIGPLVVWLLKKEEDPFIDYHGKEALNFNISFMIYGIVAGLLILLAIGLVLLPIVLITWVVLVIIGAVRASNGEYYRYPMTIRLVN